jgi:hypothetical protein
MATDTAATAPGMPAMDSGPLHMTVGQSRGRIKVFCRTRHLELETLSERGGCGLSFGGAERDEIRVAWDREDRDDIRRREASFGFDRVFPPDASNAHLFEEVGRPLVTSVLCGCGCGHCGLARRLPPAAEEALERERERRAAVCASAEKAAAAAAAVQDSLLAQLTKLQRGGGRGGTMACTLR